MRHWRLALLGPLVVAGGVAAEDARKKPEKKARLVFKVDWPAGAEQDLPRARWADVGGGRVAAVVGPRIRIFDKKTGALSKTLSLPNGFKDGHEGAVGGRLLVIRGPRQAPAAATRGGRMEMGGGDETLQVYDLAAAELVFEWDAADEHVVSGDRLVVCSEGTYYGFALSTTLRKLWETKRPRMGGLSFGTSLEAHEEGPTSCTPGDQKAQPDRYFHFNWKTGGLRTIAVPPRANASGRLRFAGEDVGVLECEKSRRFVGFDIRRERVLYDVTPDLEGFVECSQELGVFAGFVRANAKGLARDARILDLRTGAVVSKPTLIGAPALSEKGAAWMAPGPAEGVWATVVVERNGKSRTTGTHASGAPDGAVFVGRGAFFATRSAGERTELLAVDPWSGQVRVLHDCAAGAGEERTELRVLGCLQGGQPVVAEVRRSAQGGEEAVKVLALELK